MMAASPFRRFATFAVSLLAPSFLSRLSRLLFQKIPNFGQQLLFGGRFQRRQHWSWVLEPVNLFNHLEQYEGDDKEFDNRVEKQSIRKDCHPIFIPFLH